MELKALPSYLKSQLKTHYEPYELEALLRYMSLDFFGIHTALLPWNDTQLSSVQLRYLNDICTQLQKKKPYEHILGFTSFMDMQLRVSSDVLIPRPETEMLVHLIVQQYAELPDLNILDICTGSGCIPIALAHHLKTNYIAALELSTEALNIAQYNANFHNSPVEFITRDVLLDWQLPSHQKYDIIVSNPPYVLESQKKDMHPNVLTYDPHMALFVQDHDPILFYRHIAQKSIALLKPNGKLFLEINPLVKQETLDTLIHAGYTQVDFIADEFRQEDRFIQAKV